MKLKNTVYKTIEVAEDEDYGMVVGNIVMDGDKMLYAEIVDSTICDHEELAKVRAFIGEVDDMMTTNTSDTETTPIINEECVGCCKVVDIAAKLQKELDEYKETILVERIDHAAEKTMINRKFSEDLRKLNATIGELKDRNAEDLHELYAIDKKEIDRLKNAISARDLTIESLTTKLSGKCAYIGGCEEELDVYRQDSKVLKKVVEIVKNWDDSTGRVFPTLYKILDELVDYTDAIERADDTTIDSRKYNVTPDNTSYTVEMDIRCE